jgi:VCBS repeat-containing protein
VILPKAAAEHLPDVAVNNLPGFITVPTVESTLTTSASLLAGDPPDPKLCPRSITFTVPGAPGVTIHGEDGEGPLAGELVFTVTVNNTASLDGNLGGLFFQFNDTKLTGLNVSGPDVAFFKTGDDTILNLGNGLNMSGAVTTGFDLGIAFSVPSNHVDITTTTFVISDSVPLSLDDLHQAGETSQVGVRVTAVGSPGGPRHGSEKITAFAPYPPTAMPDTATVLEDESVTINVLGNDVDLNNSPLTIDKVSQPDHGTVTINADGTLTYTTNLDYINSPTSNVDTFQYCIHDALGGEDSATVSVTVTPVADPPTITVQVLPWQMGDPATETRLLITATSGDFGTPDEGSDFIKSLQFSGLPGGVTLSDTKGLLSGTTIITSGQPGMFTDEVDVLTPTAQNTSFNLGITAINAEIEGTGSPAEAPASASQPIVVDYSQQSTNVDFTATNQSIWDTGGAFTTDFNKFLGIDTGASTTLGGTFLGAGISVGASFHIKTGFQMDLSINSGSFNADLPYNITFNDTYNKTNDTLEIDPFDTALSGGHISTLGPNGSFSLDFVFDAMANATITLSYVIGSTSASIGTTLKTTLPIVHFNSTTANVTIGIPPEGPIATLSFAWPNVNTSGTGGPGTISSVGTSNPIVNLDLDLIALALAALGISPDPLKGSVLGVDYDLLSADVSGGIAVQQKFDLNELGLTPTLTLEDGTVEPFTFGTPLFIPNASTHDSNNNGTLAMSLDLTPDANLHNNTSLAAQLGFGVTALKIDGFDPLHFTTTIPLGNLGSIYNKSFPVNFQSATVNFSQSDLQHA